MLVDKIILHTPVSDERLLDEFVEQSLRDRVSIVAVHGPGCERVEELIDWIVVGEGADDSRALLTSSHPNETLSDVMHMLVQEMADEGPVQEIRL